MLPILATLVASRYNNSFDVAGRVAQEPARITTADRIKEMTSETSATILAGLIEDLTARTLLLQDLGLPGRHRIDTTDGPRMITEDGTVIHLRPSGNAPEFRVYVEADTHPRAQALLKATLSVVRKL